MKEVVVLSLILAGVAAGLSGVDIDVNNNTTTHSNSSSEAPTSEKPSTAALTSPASSVTASSTHVETTSFASPTTTSKPPLDYYAVEDKDGSYCIIIDASISITVNYYNTTANKPESCTVLVPPPKNVTVTGNCTGEKANEQYITIKFNTDWNLTLRFERLGGKYFQSNLSLDWNLETSCANRSESGQLDNNTHLFETSTGYLCMARKVLYSNTSAVNGISGIYTEKLRLEAFQNKTKPTFSDKNERCSEDSISNLVPIIVGACLGGLIIIVLIAYLIGRKRSRRGYESV